MNAGPDWGAYVMWLVAELIVGLIVALCIFYG